MYVVSRSRAELPLRRQIWTAERRAASPGTAATVRRPAAGTITGPVVCPRIDDAQKLRYAPRRAIAGTSFRRPSGWKSATDVLTAIHEIPLEERAALSRGTSEVVDRVAFSPEARTSVAEAGTIPQEEVLVATDLTRPGDTDRNAVRRRRTDMPASTAVLRISHEIRAEGLSSHHAGRRALVAPAMACLTQRRTKEVGKAEAGVSAGTAVRLVPLKRGTSAVTYVARRNRAGTPTARAGGAGRTRVPTRTAVSNVSHWI